MGRCEDGDSRLDKALPENCSRYLPVLAATRLLHYALLLQSFEFDIIFRKTIEHGNADFLSRLPTTSEELEVKDDITIFQMSQIEALPVTLSYELRRVKI
ncbi:transposon Tf2-9 polyprotein [Trichonephila clavipes]|nr:transposon Tf2-9 polyprotein [Trichonephila clavipes]